jgi:rhamnogalacturonan endolyase
LDPGVTGHSGAIHVLSLTLHPLTNRANQSSSCGARSFASCYNTRNKWEFDAGLLREGLNTFTLALPARATAPETAVLPESVYLQYDALRLEVS